MPHISKLVALVPAALLECLNHILWFIASLQRVLHVQFLGTQYVDIGVFSRGLLCLNIVMHNRLCLGGIVGKRSSCGDGDVCSILL